MLRPKCLCGYRMRVDVRERSIRGIFDPYAELIFICSRCRYRDTLFVRYYRRVQNDPALRRYFLAGKLWSDRW